MRLRFIVAVLAAAALGGVSHPAWSMPAPGTELPTLAGIPVDFILFALTLLGVALFHHHTLQVALTGLAAIAALQDRCSPGFKTGPGLGGSHRASRQRVGDARRTCSAC